MTPEEATSFDQGFSERSAEQILEQIELRREEGSHQGCACEPYSDVFTFNRWRAQGLVVTKGEKAIKLSTFVAPTGGDTPPPPDAQGSRRKLFPRTLCVFCRCQVEKIEPPK